MSKIPTWSERMHPLQPFVNHNPNDDELPVYVTDITKEELQCRNAETAELRWRIAELEGAVREAATFIGDLLQFDYEPTTLDIANHEQWLDKWGQK